MWVLNQINCTLFVDAMIHLIKRWWHLGAVMNIRYGLLFRNVMNTKQPSQRGVGEGMLLHVSQ